MKKNHLLGISNGWAMLCACPVNCTCDAAGVKTGKCACGKEVSLMGAKGLYDCMGEWFELSDKPGKCACGADLKKYRSGMAGLAVSGSPVIGAG